MILPPTTFAAQKISITNRYIRLFQNEHNEHADGILARALRAELMPLIPFKYHGFRTIYLSVIWDKVLSDIQEIDRPIADTKFKETLQQVRKFGKWQRNHFSPTINRLFKERDTAREETRQDDRHNPSIADFSLVNGRRKMDMPSKNPNVNEATNQAFAERFLHLHPDASEEYLEAAQEAIAEANQQGYISEHWDSELDIGAIRLDVDTLEPPDPLEDFTTWTEVDEGGDLTVIANKVSFSAMPRDVTDYVHKTHNVSGDFEYLFDAQTTGHTGTLGIVGLITIADTLGAIVDYIDASEYFLSAQLFREASGDRFILREREGATVNQDLSPFETAGVRYYSTLKMDRAIGSFGQLQWKRYTDIDRTSLFNTLSISLLQNNSASKLQVAVSRNDPTNTDTITGDISNLDLQGLFQYLQCFLKFYL